MFLLSVTFVLRFSRPEGFCKKSCQTFNFTEKDSIVRVFLLNISGHILQNICQWLLSVCTIKSDSFTVVPEIADMLYHCQVSLLVLLTKRDNYSTFLPEKLLASQVSLEKVNDLLESFSRIIVTCQVTDRYHNYSSLAGYRQVS